MNSEQKSNSVILLKSNVDPCHSLAKVHNANDIKSMIVRENEYLLLDFDNCIRVKDINYIQKKRKQFKLKQYRKIFNSALKVVKAYPNYFLGYLFAGASAFKNEKHKTSGPFYLACTVLINPNCSTAWEGLLKYCRDNVSTTNFVFNTVYIGYLVNERNLDKWHNAVKYLVSSEISNSRNPLTIIAPFFDNELYSDDDKKIFIADIVIKYLFNEANHIRSTLSSNDIVPKIALEAFVIHIKNVNEEGFQHCYSKALQFFYFIGAYRHLKHFILITMDNLSAVAASKPDFIADVINFLFTYNLDPTSELTRTLANITIFKNKSHQKTLGEKLRFFLVSKAYGDHRHNYDDRRKYLKDRRFSYEWKVNILNIWNLINLEYFEMAWSKTLQSLSNNLSFVKEKEVTFAEKRCVVQSHLNVCLYLLTHSSNELMRKLGLQLCLKLINNRCENAELLFITCIASIGLNENKIVTYCLRKLIMFGAINEFLFLKALHEKSYSAKTVYLKEIQDFQCTHLLSSVCSYQFENERKALKSFYKASVMVPDSVFIYEWLGIHSYENHDLLKSKLYFEISLYYNPQSWTSINYYSTILSLNDPASCKLFLSLYNYDRRQHSTYHHLVNVKAGLSFLKLKPAKDDYYKACEYFRRCLKRFPQNKCYKEMLAESYSKFGMVGSGLKCFKECYIVNKQRHLYTGSMLGKQYFFVKGGTKYLKMMKYVANNGGKDVFIVLYNTAHAFLIKSIQLSVKKHFFLSQVYCQQGLFFCARALSISANFSGLWKLLGDILFQCSNLGYSAGFLYIPNWLFSENLSNNILLIRRLQSTLLAIRCYYAGLNTEVCAKEMQICLWNSIAVAFRKVSLLTGRVNKLKSLHFGMQSCSKGLKINMYNSMAWNLLGIMINERGLKNHQNSHRASRMALNTSVSLRCPVAYSLFLTCNAGFISISTLDYGKAYQLFLSARGTCSSLDLPWLGEMLVNLLTENITGVIQNIVYLFLLTKHYPTLRTLFMSLLILSPFSSTKLIYYLSKKFKQYSDAHNMNFKNYFLSGLVKLQETRNHQYALTDYIFALRTCLPLGSNDRDIYNSIIQDLSHCLHSNM